MDDLPRSPRPARVPVGLLGMILLVALAESRFAARAPRYLVNVAATWLWSGRSAAVDAPRAEILCFGDSLVKFGVDSRILQDRTGRPAWNLAIFQGNPAASYLLLRRALDAGARPAALVVDGELLDVDPVDKPWLWPEIATPAEALGLAAEARSPDFLASYAFARMFPSARLRHQIRASLLESLRTGNTLGLGRAFAENRQEWRRNRGTAILPAAVQVAEEMYRAPDEAGLARSWSCHPVNAAYMEKFLGLAESRGIPVFWLLPPQHPRHLQDATRANWGGRIRDYVRELSEGHPGLVVVDGQRAGYDRTALADFVHLNRRGAWAFSSALGAIIKERIGPGGIAAGPRWVEIPAFDPGGLPGAAELEAATVAEADEGSRIR